MLKVRRGFRSFRNFKRVRNTRGYEKFATLHRAPSSIHLWVGDAGFTDRFGRFDLPDSSTPHGPERPLLRYHRLFRRAEQPILDNRRRSHRHVRRAGLFYSLQSRDAGGVRLRTRARSSGPGCRGDVGHDSLAVLRSGVRATRLLRILPAFSRDDAVTHGPCSGGEIRQSRPFEKIGPTVGLYFPAPHFLECDLPGGKGGTGKYLHGLTLSLWLISLRMPSTVIFSFATNRPSIKTVGVELTLNALARCSSADTRPITLSPSISCVNRWTSSPIRRA